MCLVQDAVSDRMLDLVARACPRLERLTIWRWSHAGDDTRWGVDHKQIGQLACLTTLRDLTIGCYRLRDVPLPPAPPGSLLLPAHLFPKKNAKKKNPRESQGTLRGSSGDRGDASRPHVPPTADAIWRDQESGARIDRSRGQRLHPRPGVRRREGRGPGLWRVAHRPLDKEAGNRSRARTCARWHGIAPISRTSNSAAVATYPVSCFCLTPFALPPATPLLSPLHPPWARLCVRACLCAIVRVRADELTLCASPPPFPVDFCTHTAFTLIPHQPRYRGHVPSSKVPHGVATLRGQRHAGERRVRSARSPRTAV